MKIKLANIIRRHILFLFLLPIFFVLHGVMEKYDFVPLGPALTLTALYIGASLVLCGLFWLWYRNLTKSALAVFFIMSFQFFFGAVHDLIRNLFPGGFISKYSFILPASLLVFI